MPGSLPRTISGHPRGQKLGEVRMGKCKVEIEITAKDKASDEMSNGDPPYKVQ